MARAKRKQEETQESTPTDAAVPQQETPAAPADTAATEQPEGQPQRQWVSSLPDPFDRYGIDLGDGRRLQLSRSGKWNQMQIRFMATQEGVDPKPKKEDGDTQWLRERGWNWRGDPDTMAWTVQLLAPDEKELSNEEKARRRAGADRQAEDDFIELAQRIRERNGLPPVTVFAGADRAAGR